MKKILFPLFVFISVSAAAQIETGISLSANFELTPAQRVMQTTSSVTNEKPLLIHKQLNRVNKGKTHFWKGVAIGGSIGLFTGVVGGFVSGDDPETQWFAMTAGEKAFAYGLMGLLSGAVIGGVIGILSKKKEKSEDVIIN